MGSGFLTLGVSIDAVLCPGCTTLSDWCVVRSKDGDVQWFSERMSWLVVRYIYIFFLVYKKKMLCLVRTNPILVNLLRD